MIICTGQSNDHHDEVAFEGDDKDACPMCQLIREHAAEIRELELEHEDFLRDQGVLR